MIFNIGTLSVWAGRIPIFRKTYLPHFSYFDGGCYWKFSVLWFRFLLELSGPKQDNREYKEVSKKEIDRIIKGLK